MSDKLRYLNLDGLTEVAEYVNKRLRIVERMPLISTMNDMVVYNGATTSKYKRGSIYMYTIIKTYYKWTDLTDDYYTLSETPEIGDIVYDLAGDDTGYRIELYDAVNNQVTINNLVYDRDSAGDADEIGWISNGHTSVILNGEDKTGDEANFYAPITAGTEGQVLISQGNNTAPAWASFSGYSPSFLETSLAFIYGTKPEIENNTIIFDLDGD